MNFKKIKSSAPYIVALLMIIQMTSCSNSKELMYMNDAFNNECILSLDAGTIEYIIKPGDILYISIKSMNAEVNALFNPESSMEMQSTTTYQKFTDPQGAYLYGYEVDEQGMLNLPMLGRISVAGNIRDDVEKIVQGKADFFLKEAIVKVKLLNYKVTILGEVKSPGVYYNYNNNFTVFEALAMANGNTNYANIKKVVVVRHSDDGEKTMVLDLSDKSAWLSEGFYLHPNDYVFVEPAKNKNMQLNSTAYSMLLSSLSTLIAVLGFVLN